MKYYLHSIERIHEKRLILRQVAIEIMQRLWLHKQQGQGKEVKKMAQDPVCGMEVDEKRTPAKSRHMEG